MKLLLIALIFSLSLFSCHKNKKQAKDVMQSKNSLINRWYGQNHFERSPKSDENESLNKTEDNESTEIDAGKMYTPGKTEPNNPETQAITPTAKVDLENDHEMNISTMPFEESAQDKQCHLKQIGDLNEDQNQ